MAAPKKVVKKYANGSEVTTTGNDVATRNKNLATRGRDIAVRKGSDVGQTRPDTSSARTMKDVTGERLDTTKSVEPKAKTATKTAGAARALGGARLATGIGSLLYSKNAGEGSDFKGTEKRPAAFRDSNDSDNYTIPSDFGVKNPSDGWDDAKIQNTKTEADVKPNVVENKPSTAKLTPIAKKTTPIVKRAAPRESDASKDSRMAAYNEWVKTNRDPMSQLAKDRGVLTEKNTPSDSPVTMKRGGAVKKSPTKVPAKAYKSGGAVKSGASRGDGCAIRGRTKGKYC